MAYSDANRTVAAMSNLVLNDEDITEITQVLDRAAGTIERLEERCRTERFGRPRDWTVRGVLAVLLAAARHHQTFHIEDAAELAGELSAAHRERLGAHQRNGAPLTHRQISYAWNLISRAVDPARHTDHASRVDAIDELQRLCTELLWGTVARDIRRAWRGDLAIDATIVDTHSRPRSSDQNYDRRAHPYAAALTNRHDRAAGRRGTRRRRWDLNRRPTGADWTGHHNRFGYAHHVAVLTQNEQRDNDLPVLAVALTTTPASAHPARSATPLLDHITDHTGATLGDVLADAGYSQAAAVDWTLAIRARGGDPIF